MEDSRRERTQNKADKSSATSQSLIYNERQILRNPLFFFCIKIGLSRLVDYYASLQHAFFRVIRK